MSSLLEGVAVRATFVRSGRDPLGFDLRVSIPASTPESDPVAQAIRKAAWRYFVDGSAVNLDIPLA